MDFRTIVSLPERAPRISPATHAVILGSCFAEGVGGKLGEILGDEQCSVNPFGVLYNPRSICQALRLLIADEQEVQQQLESSLFEGRDSLWHSWLFSGNYSALSRGDALEKMTTSVMHARAVLQEKTLLMLTFGTDHFYTLKDSGFVVANCHKEIPQTFEEQEDKVDDIVAALKSSLADFAQKNPQTEILMTISPYRYKKYGFHTSQLSKSRLLLAVDEVSKTIGSYFPAYEILLDELRDYRFYAPDMLHPSVQALDYIWQRFSEWAFTPEMAAFAAQKSKEIKQKNHRTLHG